MSTREKLIFVALINFIMFIWIIQKSSLQAQTNLTDIGISVSVNDTNVQNGDVICLDQDGYKLCKTEYDSSMYGIVNNNPIAAIEVDNTNNKQILISRGETNVRVSSVNGNIKKGDFLTSSKTPGVAELALKTGYIIGTAIEDYSASDKNAVGIIKTSLSIHPRTNVSTARQNIIEVLRSGLSGLGVDPISALRYLLASAMVLTSFAIGFIYFGRIAKSGVEAIGRNPLAGIRIQTSVIINVAILLGILATGLGVAYLILAI